MNSFLQDLRYATRMLAKTPGFTIVAILTLALGIGANVAAFSIVRAVLLRPLPYRQPGQLVRVFDDLRASNVRDVGMSEPEIEDLQNRSGVFEDISAVWPISANLTGGDRPERVEVVATSTNYFTLLGANAQLGRIYTKQETVPGFIEAAVISDGFWRREFGADPHAIGKKIRLDGDLYESTMDALIPLYDKLSPGGFVIVDDYGALPAAGRFRRQHQRQGQPPLPQLPQLTQSQHRPLHLWRNSRFYLGRETSP